MAEFTAPTEADLRDAQAHTAEANKVIETITGKPGLAVPTEADLRDAQTRTAEANSFLDVLSGKTERTAPTEVDGGHDWASYSHQALYDSVNSNNDPGATGAIAAEWRQLAQEMTASAMDFKKAIMESESGWTGTGADAARQGMDTLITWTSNTGGKAQTVADQLQAKGDLMAQTRAAMPAPVEFDLGARLNANTQPGIEAFAQSIKDAQVAQATAQAAHDQAVRVMQDMEGQAQQIASGVPEFETPVNPVSSTGSDIFQSGLSPSADGIQRSGFNPTADAGLNPLNPTADGEQNALNPTADGELNALNPTADGEQNALNPTADGDLLNDLTPTASDGEQLRAAVLPSDGTQTSAVAPPASPSIPPGTFTSPSTNPFPNTTGGIPQQLGQDTTLASSTPLGRVPTGNPSSDADQLQKRVPASSGLKDPSFIPPPAQSRPSGNFTGRPGGPSKATPGRLGGPSTTSPSSPSPLLGGKPTERGGALTGGGGGSLGGGSGGLGRGGTGSLGTGLPGGSFGPTGPAASGLLASGSPRVGGPGGGGFGGPGQGTPMGGTPMGGAPGAGGGKPEEDKEYGLADYLDGESIFDDPDDNIPPAVIGDFKPRTPKKDGENC